MHYHFTFVLFWFYHYFSLGWSGISEMEAFFFIQEVECNLLFKYINGSNEFFLPWMCTLLVHIHANVSCL